MNYYLSNDSHEPLGRHRKLYSIKERAVQCFLINATHPANEALIYVRLTQARVHIEALQTDMHEIMELGFDAPKHLPMLYCVIT